MKVLHINCVYPYGSTGRLTEILHHALRKEGHTSVVVYSRGDSVRGEESYSVCGPLASKVNHLFANLSGMMYGGCYFQTKKVLGIIRKENPDIVHIQCVNGYFVNIYKLVEFLKIALIPTVITLHAEFMYTGNCALTLGCSEFENGCVNCPDYKRATESLIFNKTERSFERMKKAFQGFSNLQVIGVSRWLAERAKKSPIMSDFAIKTIHNGINTAVFSSCKEEKGWRVCGFDGSKKRILWVTSGITKEKGVNYFYDLSKRFNASEYMFAVVGADKPASYKGNIVFLGQVKDQQRLAKIYSAANVVVCVSKQESFPTVCLEAQCCGTPVVAFDVGGTKESIFNGMGQTVPFGDIDSMAQSVKHWIEKKPDISQETKAACIEYFSYGRMIDQYLDIYYGVLGNNNEN